MATKTKGSKGKKKKWVIPVAIAVVVVVGLVFIVPRFTAGNNTVQAAITTKTATVEKGTIEQTVVGSGTLAAIDTLEVNIPAGLSVETVSVEAGDTVEVGDTLATLDESVLRSAILDAENKISSIDEQIEDIKDESDLEEIKSSVSGRVKQIFAEEGKGTAQVVQENGSLVVLSIDGKMKVNFENSSLSVGDDVDVILPDGEVETGTVVSVTDGVCTVTVTDNGPEYGESVTVKDEDGNTVGTGKLEINTPLSVYGTEGVIKSVNVDENEKVTTSTELITLTEAASNEYETLLNQRTQYEDVLNELLKYSQTNSVTAEVSGTVSAVAVTASGNTATSSGNNAAATGGSQLPVSYGGSQGTVEVTLLSSGSSEKTSLENSFTFLSATGGEDATATAGDSTANPGTPAVTDINDTLAILINAPITGNTPQASITPVTGYTGTIAWDPAAVVFEEKTAYAAHVTLRADAGYRFDESALVTVDGATVSGITVSPELEQNTLAFTALFPATEAKQDPGIGGGTDDGTSDTPGTGTGNDTGAGTGGAGVTDGSSLGGAANQQGGQSVDTSALASAMSGGYSSGGSSISSSGINTSATSTDALGNSTTDTSLWENAFSMLAGYAGSLTVNVDELDILDMEIGQVAEVVLDALPDDTFSATVTKISASGTAQSGVTTYPVTLTLAEEGTEKLIEGMNASATIVTAVSEDVLVIPLAAIQERAGEQYVFVMPEDGQTVSEDGEATEVTGEQRTVETGISDDFYVEITSGLSEGEVVMYTEADNSSDENIFMMGGNMMGGGMMGRTEEFDLSEGPPSGGGNMGDSSPQMGG